MGGFAVSEPRRVSRGPAGSALASFELGADDKRRVASLLGRSPGLGWQGRPCGVSLTSVLSTQLRPLGFLLGDRLGDVSRKEMESGKCICPASRGLSALGFFGHYFRLPQDVDRDLISLEFHFFFGSRRTIPPIPTSCSKRKQNSRGNCPAPFNTLMSSINIGCNRQFQPETLQKERAVARVTQWHVATKRKKENPSKDKLTAPQRRSPENTGTRRPRRGGVGVSPRGGSELAVSPQ